MGEDTRLHDGIAGALILLGTLLGYFVNPYWLAIPGVVSALRWHHVFNGWSQEALGLAAGLDRSYVGAVERMEKLARAFGLSLEGCWGQRCRGVTTAPDISGCR